MNKDVEGVLQTMGEDYFAHEFRAVQRVYIDITTLQDFNIGALLLMIDTDDDFDIIKSNMSEYCTSFDRKVSTYFKDVEGCTEEAISAIRTDVRQRDALSLISPVTSILNNIPDIIRMVDTDNARSPNGQPEWEMVISLHNQLISQTAQANLIKLMARYSSKVTVSFTESNIMDFSNEMLATFGIIILTHITDMVSKEADFKKMTEDKLFDDTKIVVTPLVDVVPDQGETKELLLARTKAALGMFCEFEYIKYNILM